MCSAVINCYHHYVVQTKISVENKYFQIITVFIATISNLTPKMFEIAIGVTLHTEEREPIKLKAALNGKLNC